MMYSNSHKYGDGKRNHRPKSFHRGRLGAEVAVFILALCLLVPALPAWAAKVRLNLKGADIGAFIGTVADVTRKNFIVDPRVKGKVTIISSRSMDAKEVYQVFLSVLEVHGFTAVPSGNVIKIVPDADAKHSALPTVPESSPGKGDEAVTRVLEIEHVSAAQLVPILRPLIPPQGHLAAYPASNILIISDRAANIRRIVQIIKRIDQPTSGEIEFVQLLHAAAADVVRVLTALQQQGKKKDPKAMMPILVADERTNSILLGGEKARRLQLRAIIAHLDTPSETVGDTHVIYLRYAKAKDLVPVLTGVQSSAKKKGIKGRQAQSSMGITVSIHADEATNALVITAPPGIFRTLKAVIDKLDIRRAQVLVEAIIAEVSSDITAELGVDWVTADLSGQNSPVTISNPGGGIGAAAEIAAGIETGTVKGIPGGFLMGLGRMVEKGLSFGMLLRALKTDSSTNILSTPTLVTMDNEEAYIVVGQEVPFITGSFTSTGTGGVGSSNNPFQTIKRKNVGIELRVKPQINEGDTIKLEIEQSVDSISLTGGVSAADIITNKRSIKTTVMVDNGKILVLGGLIKDNLTETETKIPILGDIPLLGVLFRSSTSKKTKTNLMVFLRPVILRNAKAGLHMTQSKYNFMRQRQLSLRDEGVTFMSDDEAPVMPEINEYLELPPVFEDAKSE